MGVAVSQCSTAAKYNKARSRIQALEEQLRETRRARAGEARAYEQHAMIFARREEEWREERKKYKDEFARLRRKLQEEEERVRRLENAAAVAGNAGGGGGEKAVAAAEELQLWEKMKVEQARREDAVEKWKQLYHAIKVELDDLIQKTRQQGERVYWSSEGVIEGFQRELKVKEEMLENLQSRVAVMEKDAARKDREIDILRQSLRILGSTKRGRPRKNFRGLRGKVM